MSWVKLDDKFPDHPKLISVGPLGVALQVAALCYSNAHLTDGFIQYNVLQKLLCWEFSPPGDSVLYTVGITSGMSGQDVTANLVSGWLVDAGIWDEAEGGYQIHDYSDYQPSKEQVLLERNKAQTRMQKVRSAEVRPNKTRTKPELPPKFNDPVPVPVPNNDTNESIKLHTGGQSAAVVPVDAWLLAGEQVAAKNAEALPPEVKNPGAFRALQRHEAARANGEADVSWCMENQRPFAKVFIKTTGIEPQKKEHSFWNNSLREIWESAIPVDLFEKAIRQCQRNGLTIKSPQSIYSTARSLLANANGHGAEVFAEVHGDF